MLPADFLRITKEKFYRAVKDEAKPLFSWFSLTDDCNLRCRYYFADAIFLSIHYRRITKR